MPGAKSQKSDVGLLPGGFLIFVPVSPNRLQLLPFSGKEKRAFKEFNIGIMLSHIMLAAEELWMNMETQVEDQFAKKDYKNGEYVCTIVFHS